MCGNSKVRMESKWKEQILIKENFDQGTSNACMETTLIFEDFERSQL